MTPEVRAKISHTMKNNGYVRPEETRKLISKNTKLHWELGLHNKTPHGKPWSQERKDAWKGPNNPNWKGGVENKTREQLRNAGEHSECRKAVFERDNYTCQMFGKRGNVQADHTLDV